MIGGAGSARGGEHGLVRRVLVLDGPVGTELARRGVPTPLPLWSAAAIDDAPDALRAIHADFAAAGATVHTANTFRTDPWSLRAVGREADARRLTKTAVALARDAVPAAHRVAGSLAPLEDCYRPDLSPPPAVAAREHGAMAELLAESGVDLVLCETFPHPGEALLALAAVRAVGLPAWVSLTPGPFGDLLDDGTILATAERAMEAGAERVLVNCGRPERLEPVVRALVARGVPAGAYGNVGRPCDQQGWQVDAEDAPGPYGAWARRLVEAGAGVIGGCCGTTPAHVAAVARALAD